MKQPQKISKLVTTVLAINFLMAGITSTANASPLLLEEVRTEPRVAPLKDHERLLLFVSASREANDVTGIENSLYKGKFFRPGQESLRKCILNRESAGNYKADSGTGKYRGAYQFNPDLTRGVSYMLVGEHKQLLGSGTAKDILAGLRAEPINEWNRYWQDAAFYTVANWRSTGSGLKHWDSTRFGC
jgi:hypothetical protein